MNNSNNQTVQSENPKFIKANLKISEVAQALQMDQQSVRVMIQQGIVSWGKAWRRTGSRHYSYLISPQGFYEATGVALGGAEDD